MKNELNPQKLFPVGEVNSKFINSRIFSISTKSSLSFLIMIFVCHLNLIEVNLRTSMHEKCIAALEEWHANQQ